MKKIPKKRVLALINEGLKVLDKPQIKDLPKGARGAFGTSPLAKAFNSGYATVHVVAVPDKGDELAKAWGTYVMSRFPGSVEVQLPDDLTAFMRAFNEGEYPELERQ